MLVHQGVNKNLKDRETIRDYSIRYLKKACAELAIMLRSGEEIGVVDRDGESRKLTLYEVVEMLDDLRAEPDRLYRSMGKIQDQRCPRFLIR